MSKEESRELHILLPATWRHIYSIQVALKLPCLFKDSLEGSSPCQHHHVPPMAIKNTAVRLEPQTTILFHVQL